MNRSDLIKQCRYYRGETTNPFDDESLCWFWDMERVYVKCNGEFDGEREYYDRLNGKKYPGIPNNLLSVMFTSWAKYAYNIQNELSKFYKLIDEYLAIANDHFAEDKIPS